jgi:hypothetical protein
VVKRLKRASGTLDALNAGRIAMSYVKYVKGYSDILNQLSDGIEYTSSLGDEVEYISVSYELYDILYKKCPEMCLKSSIRSEVLLSGSLVGFHYKIKSSPDKEQMNIIWYDSSKAIPWPGGYPVQFISQPSTNIFEDLYRKYFG